MTERYQARVVRGEPHRRIHHRTGWRRAYWQNAACDEARLRRVVDRIAGDERCYWVGLGDYCDFINIQDKRFSPDSLASWVKREHLGDLAKAQRDRFLDFVRPVAGRCLGLIEGNHERTIQDRYERAIYHEIVTLIKEAGGFEADDSLALGYEGWLILAFHRAQPGKRGGVTRINVNLHHGFVGGRLAGAKALNMQRWLWTHNAHLVIFGHSHNTAVQSEAVEEINSRGTVRLVKRIGCYAGTFLRRARYASQKGYFPQPVTGVEVKIYPGRETDDLVKVLGG